MSWNKEQFKWLESKAENYYTQFGEWGILNAIFDRIGTNNKYCLEVGASDGLFFSNTRGFIEQGWRAILIEQDVTLFERLKSRYRDNEDQVTCLQGRVEPTGGLTLDSYLNTCDAPKDIDLVVIDIDSGDYHIFNSLLSYRPRVVVCEYDPAAAPDFIPEIVNDHRQAGLNAVAALGIGRYYWPVAVTSTNVIFVQQELCHLLVGDPSGLLEEADPATDGCAYKGWLVDGKPVTKESYEASTRNNAELPTPRVAAVMSTPRIGFLSTMDCIGLAIHRLGMSWFRGEGAFWSHALTRGIESAIKSGHNLIVTIDYDSIFEHEPTNNAIAKLICLMMDNPDVDVIVAGQMKREGGPLLATTKQEVKLLEPLIPIQQGHFGLTIFRASVFDRLKKPWFYEQPNENGEWNENRIDADIGFWKNCEEANINVQMSLDVLIGHLELVVTWPGQDLKPVYQPINNWRDVGKPSEAFDRQRVLAAVRANPALLYSPKLEMGG